MAEVITAADLIGKSATAATTGAAASVSDPYGLGSLQSGLKEIHQFATTIDSIMSKMLQLQQFKFGAKFQTESVGVQGASAQIPMTKAQPSPIAPSITPQEQERTMSEIQKVDAELSASNTTITVTPPSPKPISRPRLRAFLADLLTVQALKLPEDVRQKKVEEITGENLTRFVYVWNGLELSGDKLLDIVALQLGDAIDHIYVEGLKEEAPQ